MLVPGTFVKNPIDTISLSLALMFGTAGLPHILVRFYTNPDGVAAKRTTMWVMILIGVLAMYIVNGQKTGVYTFNMLVLEKAGFVTVFQQHALPDEIEEVKVAQAMTITDLLIFTQTAKTKNEARRLIDQGGVKLDGESISGATTLIKVSAPRVLQVGKRKFVRLMP